MTVSGTPDRPATPAPRPILAPVQPAEDLAPAIARVLLEGFNRHYALFRECARAAKRYFEDNKAHGEADLGTQAMFKALERRITK